MPANPVSRVQIVGLYVELRAAERAVMRDLLPNSSGEFDRTIGGADAMAAMQRLDAIKRRIERLPQRVRRMRTLTPRGRGTNT